MNIELPRPNAQGVDATQQLSLFNEIPVTPPVPDALRLSPKADLHRHLLGSLSLNTVASLAAMFKVPLPAEDLDELESNLTVTAPVAGLKPFFRPWRILSRLLVHPDVVYQMLIAAAADAHDDFVDYVEFRATWGMTGREPFSMTDFLKAAERAIAESQRRYGVTCRLVLGITRHIFGNHPDRRRKQLWREILSAALQFSPFVVVGFDLSGIEEGHPASAFARELQEAREAGFPLTVHTGETTPASEIWDALKLSPQRIGHALSAVTDDRLLSYLLEHQIAVEECPTTNWLTGTVPSLREHPLKTMCRRGLIVTINTDNPSVCRTTLSREYAVLQQFMGVSDGQISDLMNNARRCAFARQH